MFRLLFLFIALNGFAASSAFAESILVNSDTNISANDMSYDGADIVVDGAVLKIDGAHGFNSLVLQNSAVLTHSLEAESKLTLNIAQNLLIDNTSSIDVSGKGALSLPGDYTQSGGSYGGLGGRDPSTGGTNAPFGDY
ncbi:hypothetical protein, partial [Microbulbifer hainanensis]|uniref:hypothetical protein n=1 Tax=Microbulbifer hainanensis TaxID=2735675 RepID=UPI0018684878